MVSPRLFFRLLVLVAGVALLVFVQADAAPKANAGTLTVTTAADTAPDGSCDSHCTFREALLAAQAGDTISFDIPGPGPHSIQPTNVLPALGVQGLTVDGYSQDGASPNTAGSWQAGNASIQIIIDGSQLTGPEYYGLWIAQQGITVQGLSIVNFAEKGIRFGTFPSAAIKGNYIGLLPDGETAGPNGIGIQLRSSQSGNSLGGTNPADRNVISGNTGDGVVVDNTAPVVITGNFFGTDSSGTAAVPNGGHGLHLAGGPGSTVGGGTAGAGNLLSGNLRSGLGLSTTDARNINVKGNRMGTTANGEAPLANGEHGVFLDQGAHDNTIGGEPTNEANIIAYNADAGVALTASAGVNNYIDPSETHSNGGLGTDLLDDGLVLENDLAEYCGDGKPDCDAGPNSRMNYPIVNSATYDGSSLVLNITLQTRPNDYYNMFFFANSVCDPSGYGEGELFLGSYAFVVPASGVVTFERTINGPDLVGMLFITTSASDPESTSEFSACEEIEFTGATPTPTATVAASPTPTATPTSSLATTPTPTPMEAPSGSVTATSTPIPQPLRWGDFDCDGDVDTTDALKLLSALAEIAVEQEPGCPQFGDTIESSDVPPGVRWGDFNCDLVLGSTDGLSLLMAFAALSTDQEPGCPALDDQID